MSRFGNRTTNIPCRHISETASLGTIFCCKILGVFLGGKLAVCYEDENHKCQSTVSGYVLFS
jgi:hypothetical protein